MRKFFQEHWKKVLVASCAVLVVGLFISTNQRFGGSISPSRVINFLSQLRDVTISSPADTEVLTYDSATGKWVNATASGGFANPATEDLNMGGNDIIGATLVSSTKFTSSAGSVTEPSYARSSDLNTGFYFPATDEWAVTTGGTQSYTANATRFQMGGTGGAYLKRNVSTYAAPAFAFAGQTGAGMGSLGSGNLFMSVLGSKVIEFSSTTASFATNYKGCYGDNNEVCTQWSTADADAYSMRIGLPNDLTGNNRGAIWIGAQEDVIGTDLGINTGDSYVLGIFQKGGAYATGMGSIDGVATIVGVGTKLFQMLNPASGVVWSLGSDGVETLLTGESGTNLALQSDLGIYLYGRVKLLQGADVASATTLTLPNGGVGTGGNIFELTGTTAVTLITSQDWDLGSTVTLIANENVTITNGTASAGTVSSGAGITIKLAGAANFSMTADDTLTLVLSSTTAGGEAWREVSRSVN